MKKLTVEEKAARAKERERLKDLARIEAEKNQKPVKRMEISVEWVRSATWGMNPRTSGKVQFQDGTWDSIPEFKCSGCGYDKESTVVAEVFDHYLKAELWKRMGETGLPYGVTINPRWCNFHGGIGMSGYYRIVEWLGGKMSHVGNGKMFDAYVVEF